MRELAPGQTNGRMKARSGGSELTWHHSLVLCPSVPRPVSPTERLPQGHPTPEDHPLSVPANCPSPPVQTRSSPLHSRMTALCLTTPIPATTL